MSDYGKISTESPYSRYLREMIKLEAEINHRKAMIAGYSPVVWKKLPRWKKAWYTIKSWFEGEDEN